MPHPERAWTVLAYIVADHSGVAADSQGADIDQVARDEADNMRRSARGQDDMYLALQVDFTRTRGVLRVNPDNPQGESLTEEQAGGAEGLAAFIATIKQEYPARHYMLVLWGHGAGPVGLFDDPDTGPARENSPESISLRELRTVLRAFGDPDSDNPPLDVLLVKSCCMATVEATFEVCDLVRYMLCSQAKVPIRTWTVWDVFDQLRETGDGAGPVALAVLDALDKHYERALERNERREIPFTLIETPHIRELKGAMTTLCDRLLPHVRTAAVREALATGRPGEPGDDALLDLVDVCSALRASADAGLADAARAVVGVLRTGGRLIPAHRPENSAFHGLSVFVVPPIELRAGSFADDLTSIEYEQLRFSRATGWHRIAFGDEAPPAFPLAAEISSALIGAAPTAP